MKGKKIVITGVCGFIGRNLVLRLKDGNEIIGVDNFEYSDKNQCKDLLKDIMFIEGDVSKKETFDKLPSDVDYVFHFGAPSSIILFNKNLHHCYEETVLGLLNAFEFAKKNSIKKVVFPSSGSIYSGNNPPHAEHVYPKPRNSYGAAKMACEAIASSYKDFVDSIGLRIFAGYGPGEELKGDFASVVYLFIRDIVKNKSPVVFGDGTQTRDFIFIDDVVDAIIKSAETTYIGIINVGSGISTSFNDVIKTINDILGRDVKPTYVHKEKNYVEKLQADTRLMKDILKIKPIPLRDGIERFLRYLGYI